MIMKIDRAFLLACLCFITITMSSFSTIPRNIHAAPHDEEGVSVDIGGPDGHDHHPDGGHGHGHGSSPPVHVRVPGGYIDIPGEDVTPSNPLTVRVPGLGSSSPVHVHVRVPEHESSPVVVRVPPQEEEKHGGHAHDGGDKDHEGQGYPTSHHGQEG